MRGTKRTPLIDGPEAGNKAVAESLLREADGSIDREEEDNWTQMEDWRLRFGLTVRHETGRTNQYDFHALGLRGEEARRRRKSKRISYADVPDHVRSGQWVGGE